MTISFHAPSLIEIGAGASALLPAQAKRMGVAAMLLVADPFLVETGLAQRLADQTAAAGIKVTIFSQIHPDPRDKDVIAAGNLAAELIQEHGSVVVVGLGGGSALDTAKVAAALATNGCDLRMIEGTGQVARDSLPVIAIPTTAGTGSEATKVAVITDTENDVKVLINDARLMPRCALVDYELTLSMPPSLTAHVGIDTLTHGIEAYVSRRANSFSDPLSLKCISLAAKHLEQAYRQPDNPVARAAMMEAATLGGLSFTNSSVALVHAMARPIGALFHVSHGLSNAMLLPTITRFSLPAALARYADIARAMELADGQTSPSVAAQRLVDELGRLNDAMDIPTMARCPNLTATSFNAQKAKMATDALLSGSADNNPIIPTHDQVVELYEQAFVTA